MSADSIGYASGHFDICIQFASHQVTEVWDVTLVKATTTCTIQNI
jgi:hypothetical protein